MSPRIRHTKALARTLFTISIFSGVAALGAYLVQKKGEASIETLCSYLDPPIIDILAFSAALYLIIEGIYHLVSHDETKVKESVLAGIRIAFGCAILTLHIMQFIHK